MQLVLGGYPVRRLLEEGLGGVVKVFGPHDDALENGAECTFAVAGFDRSAHQPRRVSPYDSWGSRRNSLAAGRRRFGTSSSSGHELIRDVRPWEGSVSA